MLCVIFLVRGTSLDMKATLYLDIDWKDSTEVGVECSRGQTMVSKSLVQLRKQGIDVLAISEC